VGTAGLNCEKPCDPAHGTADAEGNCVCQSAKWTGDDCKTEVPEELNLLSTPLLAAHGTCAFGGDQSHASPVLWLVVVLSSGTSQRASGTAQHLDDHFGRMCDIHLSHFLADTRRCRRWSCRLHGESLVVFSWLFHHLWVFVCQNSTHLSALKVWSKNAAS